MSGEIKTEKKTEKLKQPPPQKTRSGINPDVDFRPQSILDWGPETLVICQPFLK